MKTCPHCAAEIRVNELPHPGLWKDYRVCPGCGGRFTTDPATKRRQAIFIVVAVVSLVLTILMYIGNTGWLVPALMSYLFLGVWIYRGNKQLFFVPYDGE